MSFGRTSPVLALIFFAPLALISCVNNAPGLGAGGAGGSGASTGSGAGGANGAATGSAATSGNSSSGNGNGASSSAGSSGAGGGVPCAAAAQYAYAIGSDKKLYKLMYDPGKPFVAIPIGALDCASDADPYAIAVDRSGEAWVVYADGKLFTVDITTAACASTAFVTGQHGFTSFSLAFAADAPGSQAETLYAAGSGLAGGATGLAKIDTATLSLTPIGSYSDPKVIAPVQLAGTIDATLWAGYLDALGQYGVANIDPANANVIVNDDFTPGMVIHGLPAGTHYSMMPWNYRFSILATVANGTKNYWYNPGAYSKQAPPGIPNISTDGDPTHVTPITILTASASTCASSNAPW